MPAGDRTGPFGFGPRTGRGFGYCAGYNAPGFAYPWRRGGGRWAANLPGGRGWRHQYYATGMYGWQRAGYPPIQPEDELNWLNQEVDFLNSRLEAIHKRIAELERKESQVQDE